MENDNMTENYCFNCKHHYKDECTLFDELVIDNAYCPLWSNNKKKNKR